MRKNIIILLILTVILISGCTDVYEITVINESSYSIDFDFITGHRLGKYHLEPEEEWHYSLLVSLDHSMGTFTLSSDTPDAKVDYCYSDNVYIFYDVIEQLPPDENQDENSESEP